MPKVAWEQVIFLMVRIGKILMVNCAPSQASMIRNSCNSLHVEFNEYNYGDETTSVICSADWDLLIINAEGHAAAAIDVCKTIRSLIPLSQIIVISRDHRNSVIAQWLSHGADDYISTPFSSVEFKARVSVALRRSVDMRSLVSGMPEQSDLKATINIETGSENFEIDPSSKTMVISGTSVSLTRTELLLLLYLVNNQGRPCSKLELLEHALGYNDECYLPSLYTHMNRLRGKFKKNNLTSPYIATVWRYGYKIVFEKQPGIAPIQA